MWPGGTVVKCSAAGVLIAAALQGDVYLLLFFEGG